MDLYYKKYLKYKEKYLNLKKNLLQKGGENDFSLLSFNILSPHEKVSLITFRNIFNSIYYNSNELISKIHSLIPFDSNFLDIICETIALADKKRYEEKRIYNILDIINKYLHKSVIFLQEVDQFTLDRLNLEYADKSYILYNQDNDILKFKRKDGIKDYSRIEYRVVIIPKELYTLIKTCDLPLVLENENAIIKKNGVFAEILDNRNGKTYKLINVHIHYTFTEKVINEFISIIKDTINYNKSDIFIFGGDTNKSLSELSNLISEFNFNSNNQDESIQTFIKSRDLTSSPDHVLTSNLDGKINIITKDDEKQILYDTNIINIDIINCLLNYIDLIKESKNRNKSIFEIDSVSANLLVDELCSILSENEKYISDHNPILFESD